MSKVRDVCLLVGRTVLGSYLFAHGAQKLYGSFGGPGIEAVSAGFERIGLRPGRAMATLASASEIGGGLLTAAGLADPVGPVAIAGTMAVASSTHRANGPFSANRGYELPLTNLGMALVLAATGPGRYSVDGATGLRLPRWIRRLVLVGAAVLSAAALSMVLRNRPPAATGGATAGPASEASTSSEGSTVSETSTASSPTVSNGEDERVPSQRAQA
jgi:putative oxidoreductase